MADDAQTATTPREDYERFIDACQTVLRGVAGPAWLQLPRPEPVEPGGGWINGPCQRTTD